ncbi:MAG: nucleotidyl transferase AbiEii/AbiGii toxin family protein [Desulfoprunum sp.]
MAEELNIPFFVVGAFARDLIFEHIHRIPAPRTTLDIDIGVEVASWEEFEKLTSELLNRRHFTARPLPHRFVNETMGIIVDIVPFGEISGEANQISWPPDHGTIMSMVGFEEAYRSALQVLIDSEPSLEILVPSIPALALLKIISWDVAYPRRQRDAHDLLFILENYEETGIEAALYDSHVALLTEEEFDSRLAAVRLLGRDMALLSGSEAIQKVIEILTREIDEENSYRMLSDMVNGATRQGIRFNTALQLLEKLLQGIQDNRQSL